MQPTLKSTHIQMILASIWDTCSNPIALRKRQQKSKVHYFRLSDIGQEFVIDTLTEEAGYSYITAQKEGVKSGDHIWIDAPSGSTQYQIVEINYYCDVPDMWMAKVCMQM